MLGAAAGLVVAGLAALPFAGALGPVDSLLATAPGRPSTAAVTSTTVDPARASAPPTTAAPATSAGPVVEPPPIEVDDPSAGIGAAPDAELAVLPEPPPPVVDVPEAPPETTPATALPVEPPPPSSGAEAPGPDGVAVVAGLPSGPAPPPAEPLPVVEETTTTTEAPPPPPTTEPPPPPPDDPDLPIGPEPERVWAVAIGIDDYPGTSHDLRAARQDAVTVVDTLVNLGVPQDHVVEILDGEATMPRIIAAADWLAANAGPDDVAIFFYAGHVRRLVPGTELIVTADGGWVADWFLADALAPMRARQAWMVIAGCYGGGFDELLAPGRILTGAAPPNALAYENDAFGRSYLVEYVFNRALREGRAAPTAQDSVRWAMERLAEDFPDHQLWNVDRADELISVDGARRGRVDEPVPETPDTTGPPPDVCLFPGLCGTG